MNETNKSNTPQQNDWVAAFADKIAGKPLPIAMSVVFVLGFSYMIFNAPAGFFFKVVFLLLAIPFFIGFAFYAFGITGAAPAFLKKYREFLANNNEKK